MMAKKRFAKKVNSNFKIPESFSALSFKNKIISVVLLVLIVGIISSLFPENVTGGFTFNNPTLDTAKNTCNKKEWWYTFYLIDKLKVRGLNLC